MHSTTLGIIQMPNMKLFKECHQGRHLLATQIWWGAVPLQAALRCYAPSVILSLLAGQAKSCKETRDPDLRSPTRQQLSVKHSAQPRRRVQCRLLQ